jgi:hypothetical protein
LCVVVVDYFYFNFVVDDENIFIYIIMKIAKPYKSYWYFVIFVLVVFGSYVYFSKGKIFRNPHTEGLNNLTKKNKKGSTSCGPGQVSCTVVTEVIPYPANQVVCSDTCVPVGTCGPPPGCTANY